MHWDIIKWVLILFLAVPVLLLPAGIYAGLWLSKEVLGLDYWRKKIKNKGIKDAINKKIVFIILIFILVLVWGIKGHSDKSMYAQYISHQVSNDYRHFANNILRNNIIYDDILSNNKLESWHLAYLEESNRSIALHFQEYRHLALNFERIKSNELGNSTPEISEISYFFARLRNELLEEHCDTSAMLFELGDTEREIITLIYELNSSWTESILKNIEGAMREAEPGMDHIEHDRYQREYWQKGVLDSFWIDVLVDINNDTRDFLHRNHFYRSEWLRSWD